jgi:hypothetical protein
MEQEYKTFHRRMEIVGLVLVLLMIITPGVYSILDIDSEIFIASVTITAAALVLSRDFRARGERKELTARVKELEDQLASLKDDAEPQTETS